MKHFSNVESSFRVSSASINQKIELLSQRVDGLRDNLGIPETVLFGDKFGGLESRNVLMDCISPVTGTPVCCETVIGPNTTAALPVIGITYGMTQTKRKRKLSCTLVKRYESSPQELREFFFASQLASISPSYSSIKNSYGFPPEDFERLLLLKRYLQNRETIANATRWLSRVKIHMQSQIAPVGSTDDLEFLSRFHVSKYCDGDHVQSWIEWIEPITIHGRHPFALNNCPLMKFPENNDTNVNVNQGVALINVDHILLQSGQLQQDNDRIGKRRNKHVLFDAGSSTFDSSLAFFVCSYSQRKLSFNSIYAWEKTLLNPLKYWESVPSNWKPFINFFNVPISSASNHSDNPLVHISRFHPDDFIAFKLDIDHPAIETEIAQKLLLDSQISNLVDEFFFELHFRCEIMMYCGWGDKIPRAISGLQLDRVSAMTFFVNLRKRGIRSHLWP